MYTLRPVLGTLLAQAFAIFLNQQSGNDQRAVSRSPVLTTRLFLSRWMILHSVRAEGALTLWAIAALLNRRGIKTSRGGVWYPSSVANLISRSLL